MRRRNFIQGIAASAAWPLAVRAQPLGATRRIAVLIGLPQNDPEGQKWIKAFLDALRPLGWAPDNNLHIDWRWSGNPAEMQGLAKEIVEQQPELIVTTTPPVTAAVLNETRTIPVIFAVVSDPIGSVFVQRLPHPGGNATGFVNLETSIGGKWLDILKQIAPGTERLLVVFNPKTAPQSSFYLDALKGAASSLGLTLAVAQVASAQDIDAAISDFAKLPNGGLVITPDSFTGSQAQRDQIVSLATRFRIPAIYSLAFFVRAGGLVSYGVDNADLLHGAGTYVDRILKGEKPENLPVQLPTKFEFAVNLTTAKALGLTVPDKLLSTADEVIE